MAKLQLPQLLMGITPARVLGIGIDLVTFRDVGLFLADLQLLSYLTIVQ